MQIIWPRVVHQCHVQDVSKEGNEPKLSCFATGARASDFTKLMASHMQFLLLAMIAHVGSTSRGTGEKCYQYLRKAALCCRSVLSVCVFSLLQCGCKPRAASTSALKTTTSEMPLLMTCC